MRQSRHGRRFRMTLGDIALYVLLLVSSVGALLFDALPLMSEEARIPGWLYQGLFVVVVLAMGYVYRRQVKLNRERLVVRTSAELAVEHILILAVDNLEPTHGRVRYRANIMLIDEDNEELFIAFHYRMDNPPEREIRLKKNVGCAGQAWGAGEQSCADLRLPKAEGGPSWNLPHNVEVLTKHLGAILSTPIFDPEDQQTTIGMFNLDTESSLQEAGFLNEAISKKATEYASMFGIWLKQIPSPREEPLSL